MIKQKSGADPAAVLFDALAAAKTRHPDLVIVDTAGRLHTKTNLMAELSKMCRIAAREIPNAPHEVLLVIDATTGQNGLQQARQFVDHGGATGIILTKLDGTAKGGVVIAIARELGPADSICRRRRKDRRPAAVQPPRIRAIAFRSVSDRPTEPVIRQLQPRMRQPCRHPYPAIRHLRSSTRQW